ncbi:MAG: hypothetical protein IPF95_18060 [Flavobacteriales bacterium]|nr:hypothetical protein [Flavobacteriales bacterium]
MMVSASFTTVLPPWWVWLFYGCLACGVFYLVAVHVPDIPYRNRTQNTK